MSYFKSQKEIQKYLLEEEGRKVISVGGNIAGYNADGELVIFNLPASLGPSFKVLCDWRPYEEPKPWYEAENADKMLCWFWDNYSPEKIIGLLDAYENESTHPWGTGLEWKKNCRPLTRAELQEFMGNVPEGFE